MARERWRSVVGYKGFYSVSSEGRVRSEDRRILCSNGHRTYRSVVLKLHCDRNGYAMFAVSRGGDVAIKHVAVEVMKAFRGPCPIDMECCHGNGKRIDNRLTNLRYDTRAGNHADKKLHGTCSYGERSGTAKLNPRKVRRIRGDQRTQAAIAADFGVSQTLISKIKRRILWPHI